MNCRDWEERIALYAGGDLPREEAAETEGHLQVCANCRQSAAALREHAGWMREAHEQLPTAADFAAMRAGVLGGFERRRPFPRGLLWAGGLAATAAVFLVIWYRPRSEPARPAPQVAAVAKPPVMAVENLPPRPARRRRPAPIVRPKQTPEPLLVKLTTEDPDVVIYLVVDSKGD
jgi:anti-sigma factor RsiW